MNTTLTSVDFAALSPLLIVLTGALLMLLLETFAQVFTRKYAAIIVFTILAIAIWAACCSPTTNHSLLTPWLRFDLLSRLFSVLFLSIGIAITLLSTRFFQKFQASQGEYYFLLLSSLFGLILVAQSADFLTLFLGIETLSIALYVMCGYMKKWEISHEASIKYFITGAIAAAFLLYGIALIYGAIGTTSFDHLYSKFYGLTTSSDIILFLSGITLVTIGLSFKAAIVPFHTWAPDVYCGAPTPVTAFMAVGTKAGAFIAFIRVFAVALPQFDPFWSRGISILAMITLVYANIVALRQVQLRRFFAYSGISHAGFLLIPLAAGTADSIQALVFYIVVYTIATLGAFTVLAFLDHRQEGVTLNDLKGLYRRSPLLSLLFTLCLLTLAGIPPTAGFFAKFYLLKTAFQVKYYLLVIVALLTTIIAAYYYLRMVALMFSDITTENYSPIRSWPAAIVGILSIVSIVVLSIYPTILLNLINFSNK